jgi:hypothetical protein
MEKVVKKKVGESKKLLTKSSKEITFNKFFGKIKGFGDGVAFQRKMRDE